MTADMAKMETLKPAITAASAERNGHCTAPSNSSTPADTKRAAHASRPFSLCCLNPLVHDRRSGSSLANGAVGRSEPSPAKSAETSRPLISKPPIARIHGDGLAVMDGAFQHQLGQRSCRARWITRFKGRAP